MKKFTFIYFILTLMVTFGAQAEEARFLFDYDWESAQANTPVAQESGARSPASVSPSVGGGKSVISNEVFSVQNGVFSYQHRQDPRDLHRQVELELEAR